MSNKIQAADVKKLRDQTGAGMMEAKTALEEAGGDVDVALKILIKRGQAKASEKARRAAKAGMIDTYVHDGRIGVLLEINCETDFVARNEEFKKLVHEIALHIASHSPQDVTELLGQGYVRDPGITIKDLIDQKIALLGENIKISRFTRYVLGE